MSQFTIRDVLLVTVIAALCLGWAGDRHEKAARIARLATELKRHEAVNNQTYQRMTGQKHPFPLNTDY